MTPRWEAKTKDRVKKVKCPLTVLRKGSSKSSRSPTTPNGKAKSFDGYYGAMRGAATDF
jgi:hypothetical protein